MGTGNQSLGGCGLFLVHLVQTDIRPNEMQAVLNGLSADENNRNSC